VIGDVAGAADYHSGRTRHVRGLVADGDRLTIRLVRPAGDLPARIAMPLFCPVPAGTPAAADGRPEPLPSTGPWAPSIVDYEALPSEADEFFDPAEVGEGRAGRLVALDGGIGPDYDADLLGEDVGIDGGAASAEEAAMHIVDRP